MQDNFYKWIGKSENFFVQALVTLFIPTFFFHRFYQKQINLFKKAILLLSFDIDFKEDVKAIPKLIEELSQYDIKAGFACVGHWVKKFPSSHKLIVEAGHEIINHSNTHPNNEQTNPNQFFNQLLISEIKKEIKEADKIIKDYLETSPSGFRTPHFGHLNTNKIYPVLKELGYRYSSSTLAIRSDSFGAPFIHPEGIWELPVTTCPYHPHSVFDTWHSLREKGGWHKKRDSFLKTFDKILNFAVEKRIFINIYFDPKDMVENRYSKGWLNILTQYKNDLMILTGAKIVEKLNSI